MIKARTFIGAGTAAVAALSLAVAPGASASSERATTTAPPVTAQGGIGWQTVIKSPGTNVHRTSPNGYPNGPFIGWLTTGDRFRTDKTANDQIWCYGFAEGNVQQMGWVLCEALKKI